MSIVTDYIKGLPPLVPEKEEPYTITRNQLINEFDGLAKIARLLEKSVDDLSLEIREYPSELLLDKSPKTQSEVDFEERVERVVGIRTNTLEEVIRNLRIQVKSLKENNSCLAKRLNESDKDSYHTYKQTEYKELYIPRRRGN